MSEQKNPELRIPDATDKMSREDADRLVALLRLDIAGYAEKKAKILIDAAKCDAVIASTKRAIADIERRVVGVDYPVPEKAPEDGAGNAEAPSAD